MAELQAPPRLPEDAALFLDFDGTLVGIADRPDAIVVPEALPRLLRQLSARLDGRLAILSGRSLADLEGHIATAGVALSGSHGQERRTAAGENWSTDAPRGIEAAGAAIRAFANGKVGLLTEEKPGAIALHYRLAPDRESEVLTAAEAIAAGHGLQVQRGKMVAELRGPGADKGDALTALMAEPPFAGARPWFVGDDLTDEDGFRAAAGLGGAGVLVGPPRQTAARWRLGDVEAVYAWLEAAVGHD